MQINKQSDKLQIASIVIISLAIILILVFQTILNLTPPIDRDALIHHLAIPKLWLKHGGFYEIKWAGFSYFPMNIDLLYLIPLYFNKDFAAKFIHMAFGLGTAYLIFHYLKKRISFIAGLLGVLIFLSTPIVFRLSTEVYVDLGLIFFTTASVLAFIRYQDGGFQEFRWLFISAFCMGLALGTKYNALIIWFFLTLAIVFIHSRQTNHQSKSIGCGLVFFIVSLLVFSPWLIKNYILTGNPLYPLLGGIFKISSAISEEGTRSIVYGNTYLGIFQTREAWYGEGFWETLLIPVRYFYQGQDGNSQYFDGVLNPLLILLAPLAFLRKSLVADKLFFSFFIVFVLSMSLFLDQTRIRYILPAIPLLVILAVIGFTNIQTWSLNKSKLVQNILSFFLIFIFALSIAYNALYAKKYYQKIDPIKYLSNQESKDDFIARHVASYPAVKYINDQTEQDAKIRLILLADRGYYLDRTYESSRGVNIIFQFVAKSSDCEAFQDYILSTGYSHFLMRQDLFLQVLRINYPPETERQLLQCMDQTMEIVYSKNMHTIYAIRKHP